MEVKRIATRALVLLLSLSLSGCILKVNSLFNIDYPIQSDGTVDLSLAPVEDYENFTVSGFFPAKFGLVDIEMKCEAVLQIFPWGNIHSLAEELAANAHTLFSIGPNPILFRNVVVPALGDCAGRRMADGRYGIEVWFKAGDVYLPILSQDNVSCIGAKIQREAKHFLTATTECLALDPRTTINPLGLNPVVPAEIYTPIRPQEKINILTIIPPA